MDANGIMTKKEAKEWGEWIRNSISYDVGMENGIELGINRGFEQANILNIKSMLKNNISIELITKVSGKSIEEIREIEKSMRD